MSTAARDIDAAGSPMSSAASAPSSATVMGQAQDENFPVASRFLPARQRRQLLAIYGVARLIDDVGDEPLPTQPALHPDSPGAVEAKPRAADRGEILDWLDAELDRVSAGAEPEHPVMRALALAWRGTAPPLAPFRALVQANRQDQEVSRYDTFERLLGYCRLSAAPVGELVLHVFGAATTDRLALSERVCAGLQVVEHIQDVTEDYERGRIYMPREDMERFGCSEGDLTGQPASDAKRSLLAFESDRARHLLGAGAALARSLSPRPRVAVACFVAGGHAALDALERSSYDVRGASPARRSRRDFARAFAKTVLGR